MSKSDLDEERLKGVNKTKGKSSRGKKRDEVVMTSRCGSLKRNKS